MRLPEDKWPIKSQSEVNNDSLANRKEFSGVVTSKSKSERTTLNVEEDSLAKRIKIERFSKLQLLFNTTARVLKVYERFRTDGAKTMKIEPEDVTKAEKCWIKEAQRMMIEDVKRGKYVKLQPKFREGVILVGGRTERWQDSTWNKQEFILLPKNHALSSLIAEHEHKIGHLGVAATVSNIRSKYWIIGVKKLVQTILSKCIGCKKKNLRLAEQMMSPLPIERIKPSPPFFNIGVDYFGPYQIKGGVQKRVKGKGYGVIFTCLSARAVYVDIAQNLSTDAFLQVLRRFVTLRGWPSKIYSDKGTNLVAASNELKYTIAGLDWNSIEQYSYPHGTSWSFPPASAPWYNGATEALIKSVKKALQSSIGETVLTFGEMQTSLFEAAQLVNQRPIGVHPSRPEDGSYICPNDLILGRSSVKVPQGPFQERIL